jgi:hypothetical protein
MTNILAAATVGVNKGFLLAPNTPAYAPNAANGSTFFLNAMIHEVGHVLGLQDAPVPTDPTTNQPNPCLQTSASAMNGVCGTNDSGGTPEGLTPCDTAAVKSAEVAAGQLAATTSGGGGSPGGGSGSGSGTSGNTPDPPSLGGCYTDDEWDDTTNTVYAYCS